MLALNQYRVEMIVAAIAETCAVKRPACENDCGIVGEAAGKCRGGIAGGGGGDARDTQLFVDGFADIAFQIGKYQQQFLIGNRIGCASGGAVNAA